MSAHRTQHNFFLWDGITTHLLLSCSHAPPIIMSIVPKELQYSSGGKPVAIAASRRTVKVIPEAGSSKYNPETNNTIRIDLSPSLGFVDVHNSYLSFRVKTVDGTVDHTQECRLDKSAMSWVRRLTIHSSTGSILEDIDHYNLAVNLLHTATGGVEYSNTIGRMVDSLGDKAARNAAMANKAGCQYNSGFDASGLLNGQGRYLPVGFMQGALTIELVLADFKSCFVGSAASGKQANYEVLDVEYHASCVSMSPEYNARFSEQLRSRGVDMSFTTYKTHTTTFTSPNMDLPISQNSASVKGSYHVLRSKDKYNSADHDSLTTYKSGNLEEVMWDLGGVLYPTQPLRLKDDGCTSMYTHNLQAWNMHRNHALSCKVDDTNFWSTEATNAPLGSSVSTYKALPVRRVYGTYVANSAKAYKFTATLNERLTHQIGADTYKLTRTVDTLHFIPNDPKQVHLIEQGMRCKMGLAASAAAEASDGNDVDIATDLTNVLNATTHPDVGLDRFFQAAPTGDPTVTKNNNYVDGGRNVMFPGASCAVSWGGGTDNGATDNKSFFVSGIGVPLVDGAGLPIMSKANGFVGDGWIDIIPSDESFYIGNSFETFNHTPSLVSGADLTNATPLHIRLKYSAMTDDTSKDKFYEDMSSQDVFTSFIAIDAVCRLQPDGTVISSV